MQFQDFGLNPQLLNAIAEQGYEEPTPVQEQVIPLVLSGQHVIGVAPTGTGKTAAYLLPMLYTLKYAQGEAPRALILVPTKELVLQVSREAKAFAQFTDLRIAALYGGVGPEKQAKAEFAEGCDLVVATPRRVAEMYEKYGLLLKQLKYFVLDEADRMLDMGFLPQINALLDVLPRKKQNLLFSATFSPEIEELSWNFMDFPKKVEVEPEATPVDTVEQCFYQVPNTATKLQLLLHLLKDEEAFHRVLIFCKTKKRATEVFEFLSKRLPKASMRVIHSNKSQNARINVFEQFRDGGLRIVVSTDVMARGIDIPEVSHVVNFDVPTVYEDYVHRIGRTGRAKCTGAALSFVQQADMYHLRQIEKKIRMPVPPRDLPAGLTILETPFEELQEQLRAIDHQKRKDDPDFKGAFHDKKDYKQKKKEKQKKRPQIKASLKSYNLVSSKKKVTTSKHHRKKKD